jgi:hypothetical protein
MASPFGRRRIIAKSPFAEQRAAGLDDYFHDVRVEPVAEGEGWARIQNLPQLFLDA